MRYTFRQVLSRPDRDGRCRIVLDVTWENKREKLPTGVSCQPAHFNPTARRVVSIKDPDSARLNAKLAGLVAKVEKAALAAEASEENFEAPRKPKKVVPTRVLPKVAQEFHELWLEENPGQTKNNARRYKQVVAHLEAYRAEWELLTLTRKEYLAYTDHLAAIPLADSTVLQHTKFLRECFRLGGLAVPKWLKLQVRYGRAPALQATELRQLIALPLCPRKDAALCVERDMFLLQALLLLRDSDLRRLRPHHVSRHELPAVGEQLILTIHQDKTTDEVRVPLPPLAATIWQRYEGRLPVLAQQYRNRHSKLLMERVGLTRDFVRVRFVNGVPIEEVLPLWQVVTTHTARHTGADMLMLGSGGNEDLKEKALGHAAVYGHDALERYGPALLQAWANVLGATAENAPSLAPPIT
jgi:integrase